MLEEALKQINSFPYQTESLRVRLGQIPRFTLYNLEKPRLWAPSVTCPRMLDLGWGDMEVRSHCSVFQSDEFPHTCPGEGGTEWLLTGIPPVSQELGQPPVALHIQA